jgi:condensin complex subunit 1
MADQVEFDINESLKLYLSDATTIPTTDASSELLDCENDSDSLTPAVVDSALEPVIDSITENPEGLSRSVTFDTLQFLLKYVPLPILPLDAILILTVLAGNHPSSLPSPWARSSI